MSVWHTEVFVFNRLRFLQYYNNKKYKEKISESNKVCLQNNKQAINKYFFVNKKVGGINFIMSLNIYLKKIRFRFVIRFKKL